MSVHIYTHAPPSPSPERTVLTVFVVDVPVGLSVGRSGAVDGKRRSGGVEVGDGAANVGVTDVQTAAGLRVFAHLLQNHHTGRLRDVPLTCRQTDRQTGVRSGQVPLTCQHRQTDRGRVRSGQVPSR